VKKRNSKNSRGGVDLRMGSRFVGMTAVEVFDEGTGRYVDEGFS
jgi:hypothetical protein